MSSEIPQYQPEQQKFESIVSAAEGREFLSRSLIDDRYQTALQKLNDLIEKHSNLEPDERRILHHKAAEMIGSDLAVLDKRIDFLTAREDAEVLSRRESLYRQSVQMVNLLEEGLGRQLERAADAWMITDEEFRREVSDQFTYLRTDIPGLNPLLQYFIGKGVEPVKAMQKAVDWFLKIPDNQNIWILQTISRRYPDIQLPDIRIPCVRINTSENLRTMAGRVVRRAHSGELFQVVSDLSNRGRYEYRCVTDPSGREYKLCVNDGYNVQMEAFCGGQFTPMDGHDPEAAEVPLPVTPLDQLKAKGFLNAKGRLSKKVNSLTIDQVIPDGVHQAVIILNNRLNGPNIPQEQPIPIVREEGTFVFAGEYEGMGLRDRRVRIYAGDILQFQPEAAPVLSNTDREAADTRELDEDMESKSRQVAEIPLSVAAFWRRARDHWQAPNVIPPEQQDQAVCASYVQRTLGGMFGYEFLRQSGLLEGVNLQDAWMMASRVERSGYARTSVDMRPYFKIDRRRQTVKLDESSPGYNAKVERLLTVAGQARSERGLLLFHYKRTATNRDIIAHLDQGGSLNSHATLILGWGTRRLEVDRSGKSLADTIMSSMQNRLGQSYDRSWNSNRYLLGHLKNVRYQGASVQFKNGEFVYPDTDEVVQVEAGKTITYQDIQVTDFYHNPSRSETSPARIVGLVELMIQGNFEPVQLLEWNPRKVNTRMEQNEKDFIVAEWTMSESVTDLRDQIGHVYEQMAGSLVDFRNNNPDKKVYIDRTIKLLQYTQVIRQADDLPVTGTVIPVLDWSKKPVRETGFAERIKRSLKERLG